MADDPARVNALAAIERMTAATRKFCGDQEPDLSHPACLRALEEFGLQQMRFELEVAFHAGVQAARAAHCPRCGRRAGACCDPTAIT